MKKLILIATLFFSFVSFANESCVYIFDILRSMSATEQKEFLKAVHEAGRSFASSFKLPQNRYNPYLPAALNKSQNTKEITLDHFVKYEPEVVFKAIRKAVIEFSNLASKLGRMPTSPEFKDVLGLTDVEYNLVVGERGLFENLKTLAELAKKEKPGKFTKVVDTYTFDKQREERLVHAIKTSDRLIVTAAAPGVPVNRKFLQSLLVYAKEKNATIIVLPENGTTEGLDPILLDTPNVHISINWQKLSPYLSLNNLKTMFKQMDNTTGAERFGKRGEVQIIAGAKMIRRPVATIDGHLFPHYIVTSGAITEGYYVGDKFIQERTNAMAAAEHKFGALVLEKNPGNPHSLTSPFETQKGFFHIRPITFSKELGGFVDLDGQYTPRGYERARIGQLTLGDVHVGVTDPFFLATLREVILKLRPQDIILHDLFDGLSINHHERNKSVTQNRKFKKGELDLTRELQNVVLFLNSLMAIDNTFQIRVMGSNHNSWLKRWLEDEAYLKDPQNKELGERLKIAANNGQDPLQHALVDIFGLEYPKRITFVTEPSFNRNGVELAMHGDIGPNGVRGSVRSLRYSADKIIVGHSHTPVVLNSAMSVGTSTLLRQGYNATGPSSWMINLAATSIYGTTQSIDFVQGTWWSNESRGIDPDAFFFRGYPELVPLPSTKFGRVVDQYGGVFMKEFPTFDED